MTSQYTKLKTLLQELFQLDQPDLDFGLYRVMHAKSAEVTTFLDKDLLPQVQAAFAKYHSADKAELEKELAKAIEQAQELGVDPESTQKVKELQARISSEAVDVRTLEREVYDHLYSFFRRYYSEGDYLAKRVYKPGVYAIPYEGEEVTLHWANKDQYYIKTSEYLRDYAFRLRPDDEQHPLRVHFRLVDAAEGEHGNAQVAEGKQRRFKLSAEQPPTLANGELVIHFTYLPNTKKQADLNAEAEAAVLAMTDEVFADWIAALQVPAPTEKDATRTVLAKHLKRYADLNTFDYFIHKDLGGFLRRELDFYIKNEVMHLDDVENDSAARVGQYLSKIKVIRRIAGKIIAFLAHLEDFQKKLWLKKKFVVDTQWCIIVGSIPERFYPEIAGNEAQHREWVELLAIGEIKGDPIAPGYSKKLDPEFLKAHPTLVVDTRHFKARFTEQLLEACVELDDQIDGVLFHSENFQALNVLHERYRQQIRCVYIDPPYNAQSSAIAYKNDYQHSSWLSLMQDRVVACQVLLEDIFVFITAIDEVENVRLSMMYSELFAQAEDVAVSIVHNPTGQQGSNFSFTHEFAHFVFPRGSSPIGVENRDDPMRDAEPDIRPLRNVSSGKNHYRDSAANCFYPIYVKDGGIVGFGAVCADDYHPPSVNIARDDGIIEVYPIDPSGDESKWVFARDTVESIAEELTAEFNPKKKLWDIIRKKGAFRYKSLWTDKRYSANSWGSVVLNNILPGNPFTYPKSVHLVRDCVDAGLKNAPKGTVLDYFAGSGTTGHAVINLNREDGGRRKFILVEMGDYFDTVLLPRIKKVSFSPEWKGGKPKRFATAEEAERSPRIVKILRLESYEDTLNNLATRRTPAQQFALDAPEAQRPDGFKEQYLLRYMLDVETRGSQSLLNVQGFADPTAYRLKVKSPGSDESREMNVDLLETFNWLVGLKVRHIAAPQTYSAGFVRDTEGRLRLKGGRIEEDLAGPYWFRAVAGTTPEGRNALVIWRKLIGDPEQDNLALDAWFTEQGYSAKDSEFDVIWVNGGNNLENLKTPDDRWKVRLIEEDFHRLMFEEVEA